jgi:type IV secretory pathway VirB10-like protein
MAIQNPWHIAAAAPKPVKPLQNPWNINIPGSGLASNNGSGGAIPLVNPPAPVAPPAPPAPPPPPPDYEALVNADPNYISAQSDLARQNELAMDRLLKNFKGTAQGYQDNANAHGALFSGAAVNAQRSASQAYTDQSAQQAQDYLGGQHTNKTNAWQRILQQLAGGS